MKRHLALAAALCLAFCWSGVAAEKDPVVAETNALIAKINTRYKSGGRTAEDFKAELAEFDTLIAAHRSEKTDAVAAAIMMKASFYIEIAPDFPEARKLLAVLKSEFPKTRVGASVDEVLGGLQQQEETQKIQAALTAGKPFPDFQEKDLTGQPLSISGLKGKVVLVDFWATWCGPCVQEMPNVVSLYEKFHAQGLEIVGISLDKEKDKVTAFITANKMPWPQYFDGQGWQNKLATKYGVTGIPQTYLLDKSGNILASGLRGEELATAVQTALAAR